jgi:hypothetical protein
MHGFVGAYIFTPPEKIPSSKIAGLCKSMINFVERERARHWWLMPVILATQEAEIRRMLV